MASYIGLYSYFEIFPDYFQISEEFLNGGMDFNRTHLVFFSVSNICLTVIKDRITSPLYEYALLFRKIFELGYTYWKDILKR